MVLRAKQPPFNIIIVDFISGINRLPGLEGFMLVSDVLNQSTELCVEHINCKNKMAKVTFLKMEATTGLAPPTSVSMTEYHTFKVPFLSLTVCPSKVSSSKSLLSVNLSAISFISPQKFVFQMLFYSTVSMRRTMVL